MQNLRGAKFIPVCATGPCISTVEQNIPIWPIGISMFVGQIISKPSHPASIFMFFDILVVSSIPVGVQSESLFRWSISWGPTSISCCLNLHSVEDWVCLHFLLLCILTCCSGWTTLHVHFLSVNQLTCFEAWLDLYSFLVTPFWIFWLICSMFLLTCGKPMISVG